MKKKLLAFALVLISISAKSQDIKLSSVSASAAPFLYIPKASQYHNATGLAALLEKSNKVVRYFRDEYEKKIDEGYLRDAMTHESKFPSVSVEEAASKHAGNNFIKNHVPKIWDERYNSFLAGHAFAQQQGAVWVKNDITTMELIIGRLNVQSFEDGEMSVRVGGLKPERLSMVEAKEVASFFISHIKNESEENLSESPHP